MKCSDCLSYTDGKCCHESIRPDKLKGQSVKADALSAADANTLAPQWIEYFRNLEGGKNVSQ